MSVCVLVHVCVCVGVCVSENRRDIATTQPDRKVCVSNCSNGWGETLWAWPAPEVWTDGCSGVHRKVFGVSVVLMFMASWLHLSQAYQRDRMRHEKQTKQNHKSVFVCVHVCLSLSVSAIFCFLFALFWCQTAGHDHKNAIMMCLTEHITECLQPTKWVPVQMEEVTQHQSQYQEVFCEFSV